MEKLSNNEAQELVKILLKGYKNTELKTKSEFTTGVFERIIADYYLSVKNPDFDVFMRNFKRRYSYNENKLEHVHSKQEQEGLIEAYKYIFKDVKLDSISIYTLTDIHEKIYSKTPYENLATEYRNSNAPITDYDIDTCPAELITRQMNIIGMSDEAKRTSYFPKFSDKEIEDNLGINVPDILAKGKKAVEEHDINLLISYIEDCVKLHCKITKIHPFPDGNGRSARVFLNLMFRYVNLPPTYVENREKQTYNNALRNAQVSDSHEFDKMGNYDDIIRFYMQKICDSITALDVSLKNDNSFSDDDNDEPHIKKVSE